MGFKRLNIAVNCNSEQEQRQAQAILDELSNILRLDATTLMDFAPVIRKNQSIILQAISTVKAEAKKGSGKLKIISAITPLAMQIKT